MAGRKEKRTVEYFPHFIGDGKKIFFIEQKYGNDGYATWFKILESLASTDDHYLNLQNEADLFFLSAKCRIDKEVLISIINDLSIIGVIDASLWNERIVWSDTFIKSIEDVYSRRSNLCMQKSNLCVHLIDLGILKKDLSKPKKDRNTQTKLNYTKLNQTKEEIDKEISISLLDDFSPFENDFRIHWETWVSWKKNTFSKTYKNLESEQTAFKKLVKISKQNKLDAIEIIENSIVGGWQGLFALSGSKQNSYDEIKYEPKLTPSTGKNFMQMALEDGIKNGSLTLEDARDAGYLG